MSRLAARFMKLRGFTSAKPYECCMAGLTDMTPTSEKIHYSRQNRNESRFKNFFDKYRTYMTIGLAGVLGYTAYKNCWRCFPTLKAAVPFGGGDDTPLKGRREKFNFISEVVRLTAPSVVYIEIQDPSRLDFFTKQPITLSNGSGFIVQHDGLILTNAHVVVGNHGVVLVKLQNGSTYQGQVEDFDMKSDLATVRIPVKGLPAMKLGKSEDIRAGEWVVAIGSPLSLNNTITAGVVSSTQRGSEELGLTGKNMSYIQTDASITFGNSGGPLVNLDGEAIGINSMKVTSGISFAIPIDYAKQFLAGRKDKRVDKLVSKRYLGITMLSLNQQILHELKIRHPDFSPDISHGILVIKVIIDSPAYKGGLKPGDVVTNINGKKMYTSSDVYKALEENTPNVKLDIIRNRENISLTIKPEDPSIYNKV